MANQLRQFGEIAPAPETMNLPLTLDELARLRRACYQTGDYELVELIELCMEGFNDVPGSF